jgi:hypothetical protein
MKTINNENEKLIVKAILNDEIKHHKLLKTIQKTILAKLTLSEKELCDMIEESYLDFGE